MLPQLGFTELIIIMIVALIVVGPTDLPKMTRRLGQFLAKGRAMANEFRAAFDDIAKEAELQELRKEIEDLKRENALAEAVNDMKSVEADINKSVLETERAAQDAASADDEMKPIAPHSDPKPDPAT